MEAAQTSWLSLGDLFVKRGVISEADLEGALAEQVATKRRLAEILVRRGLVSGHDITSAIREQMGSTVPVRSRPTVAAVPSPPAPAHLHSSLRDEIRRRHAVVDGLPEDDEATDPEDDERAELEAALGAERAARKQMVEELEQARADTSARTAELADLSAQVGELRGAIAASTAAVASVDGLGMRLTQLETRLAAETEANRRTAAEERQAVEKARKLEYLLASLDARLDRARVQARKEAETLRSSIAGLRAEIDRLDAAATRFEHWADAASPAASPEAPEQAWGPDRAVEAWRAADS
jgi:hypothetical protein